ncbi:MAG: hydrogenase maturation protease [Proteobacteria bacterium]|nr:hydrogenase maturation protease [Pseudomonadota bacterium]
MNDREHMVRLAVREHMVRLAVIGVGNPHRSDDAVGLWAARALRRRVVGTWPSGWRVLECSGEATALMDAWSGFDAAVIVDAVSAGASPGTLHRLDGVAESVPESFLRCSTHSFGVAEAIELARVLGELPGQLIVYGVEADTFDHGEGLSAAVESAVPHVVDRILAEIRSLI